MDLGGDTRLSCFLSLSKYLPNVPDLQNKNENLSDQYILVVVQLLSHVRLFATPWTAEHQASLSFTISRSLLKLTFLESVILSKYLILCPPLYLLPSIFPSIRVFSSDSKCNQSLDEKSKPIQPLYT